MLKIEASIRDTLLVQVYVPLTEYLGEDIYEQTGEVLMEVTWLILLFCMTVMRWLERANKEIL